MKYEVTIGLETHVELQTNSKIFCACGGHSEAIEPNDCVCPACSGMPGMLPVMNKRVVELAATAGLMLNCEINRYSTFDKKNYYYPDLPCAYQITQLFHPICTNGLVEVTTKEGTSKIRIKQIHMEEDAGKLVHDDWADTTLVDFNRTSVPLIEIVTQPDFHSADEVVAYLEKIKEMFRFGNISECEEGAMRCDVNISVRPEGATELGVRAEIKNMSSLSSIERAIKFETARHIDALERGTEVLVQETRRWDDTKGRTFPMRNKETEADYRYFPDPNLMPIIIDDEWLEEIKKNMPVSAQEKAEEYKGFGISEKDIEIMTSERVLCDILDKVVALGCNAKDTVTWLLTDCAGILRKNGQVLGQLKIAPEKLAGVITMVQNGKITRAAGKKVLTAVIEKDVDPEAFCKENNLDAQTDQGLIEAVVDKAIKENKQAVNDYKNGKTKAFMSIFGACMRELKGTGDPAIIKELLEKKLQ
ncbi:MAG: Asp-tRNA(Asn)/Glu-tRNA(Gln) amidotransferase subunit GatB [Ruminococcaceae bacterium]|nr:Asp-tRNA(Asn)/Glu-tRNA(Gln) amidotransferase subunit GatB [Oscillospiraceae bacterium]